MDVEVSLNRQAQGQLPVRSQRHSASPVLLNTISNLHSQTFPTGFVGSFVCTFFTPNRQSVFVLAFFIELTFSFPLFAFGTAFVLDAIKRLMRFFVLVVFL